MACGGGLAAAFVLGLGLTAWFVIPQQRMIGDVGASNATALHADAAFVQLGHVSPGKLLGDWRNGWRGPTRTSSSPTGSRAARIYCGRSFVLGTGHLVMLALVAATGAVLLHDWTGAGAWTASNGRGCGSSSPCSSRMRSTSRS